MKKNKLGYYFILEFLKNYLSILFAFGLIIWITQAVRLLDLISEDGNSIATYFLYILSTFPKIASRISIIIFFISFVVTISKFEDHNELTNASLFQVNENFVAPSIISPEIQKEMLYSLLQKNFQKHRASNTMMDPCQM